MAEPDSVQESAAAGTNPADFWNAQIDDYFRIYKGYFEDVDAIVRRYRDDRNTSGPEFSRAHSTVSEVWNNSAQRFNVLWSTIQTQTPALISRVPKPVVKREHLDQDIVGRSAAQILERALEGDIENDDLDQQIKSSALDFQLGARGTLWVRYEAKMVPQAIPVQVAPDEIGFIGPDGERITDTENVNVDGEQPFLTIMEPEPGSERAPISYLYWKDFAHKPLKSWAELKRDGWVAKRVLMGRKQLVKRFGEIGSRAPLNAADINRGGNTKSKQKKGNRAEVWEIWNAEDKDVWWIVRGWNEVLDHQPDPLELKQFFPCPKPAYGTLTNDCLIPVPDYKEWVDQANELDELTRRISLLTEALAVKGVFASGVEQLANLVKGSENIMIGIDNWQQYSSAGGVKNLVDWFPVEVVAATLIQLYDARDKVKQDLFEISGFSDILRGQVDPRETLGQSRIKSTFGTLRLDEKKREIQRLARDAIALKGEIISEQFKPESIAMAAAVDVASDPQVQGGFQRAVQLLKSDKLRGFRLDIETDSTVEIDQQFEKENRIEFLTAISQFMERSVQFLQQAPQAAGLVQELMLYAVRTFDTGKSLETAFEQAFQNFQQPQEQEGPQTEEQLIQIEGQRVQIEGQKAQADAQNKAVANLLQKRKQDLDFAVQQAKTQADVVTALEGIRSRTNGAGQ